MREEKVVQIEQCGEKRLKCYTISSKENETKAKNHKNKLKASDKKVKHC